MRQQTSTQMCQRFNIKSEVQEEVAWRKCLDMAPQSATHLNHHHWDFNSCSCVTQIHFWSQHPQFLLAVYVQISASSLTWLEKTLLKCVKSPMILQKAWHALPAASVWNIPYLIFKLRQLTREVWDQLHGWFKLFLQVSKFILLSFRVATHKRHGTHPRKPIKISLLKFRHRKSINTRKGKNFMYDY